MLSDYIQSAMREAHYELLENGRFFGKIPPCQGVWADGSTLEECRALLQEVLEDWIIVGLRMGHDLPVVAGVDLNPSPGYVEANPSA